MISIVVFKQVECYQSFIDTTAHVAWLSVASPRRSTYLLRKRPMMPTFSLRVHILVLVSLKSDNMSLDLRNI